MADDPFAAAGFAPAPTAASPGSTPPDATQPADAFAAAGFAPAKPQDQPPSYGVGDFATDLAGSTAATLSGLRHGMAGNLPDYINAAAGTPIRMVTGWQGPGAAFDQGLDIEKQQRDALRTQYPIANINGLLTGALSGAVATAPATELGAAASVPDLTSYMLRNGAFGGLSGWLSGDTPEERVKGANQGVGLGMTLSAAGPVIGHMLQAPVNVLMSGVNSVRNLFSSAGRDAIAGDVLREAGGDFTNTAARSPIPDLELRTAQSTGNPGLAALERMEPGGATTSMDVVQNGRTPQQTQDLARALVGPDAGIEPSILTNQASAQGVTAIQNARTAAATVEDGLWQNPALQGINLDRANLVQGVNADVGNLPPSFRRTIQGGPLGGFVDDLAEGGQNTTIDDVNAVRSRVLAAARTARASGDNVTASAAGTLADSILDRLGTQIQGTDAQTAYQAARTFTRDRAMAFGHPEFDSIFRPNAAGNMRANDETQFGKFFDLTGGTSDGLDKLQGVSDLLRNNGQAPAADALDQATRNYIGPAVLRTARAGQGVDAAGLPNINVNSLNSTVNRLAPSLSATPATAPIAGDVQAAGNAAELMGRPAATRGDMNSTTFEKLRNKDLVGAVVGQAGSSSLGALAGGFGGYEYGPENMPAYQRILAGAAVGAVAGNRLGPYIGKGISSIPGAPTMLAGPTNDILRRVSAGLASPEEYQRLLAAQMLQTPGLMAPGHLSLGAPIVARAAIPFAKNRQ